MWTGSVAYYWKDWWFSLRPYHSRSRKDDGTTVTEGNSTSANFTARWYFGRPLEYLELVAGKGSGVDAGDVTNVGRLDEWVVQADVRKLLGSRWMIRGGVGYRAGENNSGEMRHSIVLRIGADVFF